MIGKNWWGAPFRHCRPRLKPTDLVSFFDGNDEEHYAVVTEVAYDDDGEIMGVKLFSIDDKPCIWWATQFLLQSLTKRNDN